MKFLQIRVYLSTRMAEFSMAFVCLLGILSMVISHANTEGDLDSIMSALNSNRSTKFPELLTNFIPVSMQVLHHCIESIQYEPTIITTTTPQTTTTPVPATTAALPTSFHKPGYFGPENPPTTPSFPSSSVSESTPTNNEQENMTPIPTTDTLLWNDKQFYEWFLQTKYKQMELFNEYNTKLLDPLPLQLLQDIGVEQYALPALLDEDNVNEFRKVYDEKYHFRVEEKKLLAVNVPKIRIWYPHEAGDYYQFSDIPNTKSTIRKRVPPTRPYIHMLMLYDLLKREARKLMFNMYEGYSDEILEELSRSKAENGQQQLLFVLSRMMEEKNIDKADIVSRTQVMISELKNHRSAISDALVHVPPLVFVL